MDENMDAKEIEFAQRLASGEPTVRKRALKLLCKQIKEQSESKEFKAVSLRRLCKGLHYALWMQDKMLLQEELVDKILELLTLFGSEEQIFEFSRALLFSLSKEWPNIDRWRMDKFLMFLRRLIRTLLLQLQKNKWNLEICERYLNFFKETLISSSSELSESLKFHCASVWLDELDGAYGNGMNKKCCLDFLRPYILLLGESISDSFFKTICAEILDTILHDYSENLANGESESALEERADSEKAVESAVSDSSKANENEEMDGLTFDFAEIATLLFEVGKNSKINSKRRKRLYNLCKKLEDASSGLNPYPDVFDEACLSKREMKKRRRLFRK